MLVVLFLSYIVAKSSSVCTILQRIPSCCATALTFKVQANVLRINGFDLNIKKTKEGDDAEKKNQTTTRKSMLLLLL